MWALRGAEPIAGPLILRSVDAGLIAEAEGPVTQVLAEQLFIVRHRRLVELFDEKSHVVRPSQAAQRLSLLQFEKQIKLQVELTKPVLECHLDKRVDRLAYKPEPLDAHLLVAQRPGFANSLI